MKTVVVALLLAASPLRAQTCFNVFVSGWSVYAAPAPASEGNQVTLHLSGYAGCPPYDGGVPPYVCDPYIYTFQSCDIVQWTFGDGVTATVTGSGSVSHVYAHAGLYDVKVHLATASGSSDVSSKVYVASVPGTAITVSGYVDAVEGGSAALHLTRSGDLSGANRVDWRLYGQDLTPSRITAQSGTVMFAPGETEHSLTFPVAHDGYYFGDDYAFVGWTLSDGAIANGGVVGSADGWHIQSTIRTHDVDPIPTGLLRDVTVKKGSASVRVPLDLIGDAFAAPCCRGDVSYLTVEGSARDGIDYVGTQGRGLNVPPLTSQMFIEIPLIQNDRPGTHTFDVLLQPQWTSFPLLRTRATVTIVDDSLALSADPTQLNVGVGAYGSVRLTLGAPPQRPVTATVVSSNDTIVASDGVIEIPTPGTTTLLFHALQPGRATLTVTPAGGSPAIVDVQVVPARRRAVSR